MTSSLPHPGLGGRAVVRCRACNVFAIESDHKAKFFDAAKGNLEARLRKRAVELDECARLNEQVWSCIEAGWDDDRWICYLGFGADGGEP
jgi:hypothetical protein